MIPPGPWTILPAWRLPRLNRQIDRVVLLPHAIVACTIRPGRRHTAQGRRAAEDAALDLYDFHAASAAYPVIPLLLTEDARQDRQDRPLLLPGVTPVVEASRVTVGTLLHALAGATPFGPPLDPAGWSAAPYRPMPSLVEAARMLYARHGVAEIAQATATNLHETRGAIARVIAAAAAECRPAIAFVTGPPGAGKTLCGLDTAFAGQAAYLTGNPSLVHVLREALARDSTLQARAARQRMQSVIQALPAFRDHHAASGTPPERVVVIDEAQRCWSATHAAAKTAGRLQASEPALLLDAMARRTDGPAIVCLVGTGQEIHAGEGGLAEWGAALAARPAWRVHAAPACLGQGRQRLPPLPGLHPDPALQLATPLRALRAPYAAPWVDAVLAGDTARARSLARDALPFSLTRDLAPMRARLRRACRGTRRAGLVCSSGARRLRAEGLGATLPHDDPAATTRWFLDRFPDIRASDALEVAATEFFVQGLELDVVGLAWDGDLLWTGEAWQARAFRGTGWTIPRAAEAAENRRNAYRVLLTRARYETVIWVPRGDAADPTRDPAALDATAAYLLSCGAHPLGGRPC